MTYLRINLPDKPKQVRLTTISGQVGGWVDYKDGFEFSLDLYRGLEFRDKPEPCKQLSPFYVDSERRTCEALHEPGVRGVLIHHVDIEDKELYMSSNRITWEA